MAPLPTPSLYDIVSKWIVLKEGDDLEVNLPEFDRLKTLPELEPKALKRLMDLLEADLLENNKRFHKLLKKHNPEIKTREKDAEDLLQFYQGHLKALSVLDSQLGFPNEGAVSSYLPKTIEEAHKRLTLSTTAFKNQQRKVAALQYMNILLDLRKNIIEYIKTHNFFEAVKSIKKTYNSPFCRTYREPQFSFSKS